MTKQEDLIEDRGIPELDAGAQAVRELTDQRMSVHRKEMTAREKLLALLREHKLKRYVYDGYVAKIVPGVEKVSVVRLKEKKRARKP